MDRTATSRNTDFHLKFQCSSTNRKRIKSNRFHLYMNYQNISNNRLVQRSTIRLHSLQFEKPMNVRVEDLTSLKQRNGSLAMISTEIIDKKNNKSLESRELCNWKTNRMTSQVVTNPLLSWTDLMWPKTYFRIRFRSFEWKSSIAIDFGAHVVYCNCRKFDYIICFFAQLNSFNGNEFFCFEYFVVFVLFANLRSEWEQCRKWELQK